MTTSLPYNNGGFHVCCLILPDYCPDGWDPYGQYCYTFNTTDLVSFSGAVEACQNLNSNLTSIHSFDEQMYHISKIYCK